MRSFVFVAVTVALATAAHCVARGAAPSAVVIVASVGIVALLAVPLSARECRTPVLLAGVAGVQIALHLLMTLSMGAHPMPMWWCGRPGVTLPARSHMGFGESIAMVAGHVAAGLLVALWLRLGEHATFCLATSLGLRVVRSIQSLVASVRPPALSSLTGSGTAVVGLGEVPSRLSTRLVPVRAGRAPPLRVA